MRLLRDAWVILSGTVLLALLVEIGWRGIHGALAAAKTKDEDVAKPPLEDVSYTLHPYFQTQAPADARTMRGPFLAGWVVHPPEAIQAKGRYRILFLGGSTTAYEYPKLVADELEKAHLPTTIYNLAWDWHTSLHTLYKIWTYADDIRPDLIVDLEGINDFFRGFTPKTLSLPVYRPDYSHYSGPLYPFWVPGHARFDGRETFFSRPSWKFAMNESTDQSLSGLLESIVRDSAVLRSLHVSLDPKAEPSKVPAPLPAETVLRALPDYERNMRNIATSCRTKGLPLVLLTMPYTTGWTKGFLREKSYFTNDDEHVLSNEDFARGMDRFNAVAVALRDEPAVRVLPLADEPWDRALFRDEVHLIVEGQRREAEIVARYILDQGLLREMRNP